MGSATPSLESWQNSVLGRYKLIEMRDRVMDRPLPAVELIDMRREFQETGQSSFFARAGGADARGAGSRRAGADSAQPPRLPFAVICRACGESWSARIAPSRSRTTSPCGRRGSCARRPAAGMSLLRFPAHRARTLPQVRQRTSLLPWRGFTTGRRTSGRDFSQCAIGRMDRDTVRGRGDLERLLTRLHSGEINLLVGTQMIAKGHDVHGVTLVGVVAAIIAFDARLSRR